MVYPQRRLLGIPRDVYIYPINYDSIGNSNIRFNWILMNPIIQTTEMRIIYRLNIKSSAYQATFTINLAITISIS